MSYVTC